MSTSRTRSARSSGIKRLALLLFISGCIVLLFYAPSHLSLVKAQTAKSAATSTSKEEIDTLINKPELSTGCGKAPPLAVGTSGAGAFVSGGIRRTYWLHIPAGYQSTHLYPLVLNLHGHGSTARHQELSTGFSELADAMSFIVVYPQGAIGPGGATGWNSGGKDRPDTNDVLFVSDLLDKLQSELCIDPDRIYAAGFSNGGGMTGVLACTMAQRIAAFASVSGSYYPLPHGCKPGRAVSILEFHGTADRTVPYAGRPQLDELSTLDWLQGWAELDGCLQKPRQVSSSAGVTELEWDDCRDGAVIIHYRITGGSHTWPGGVAGKQIPMVDKTINASKVIWLFFAMHPLPVVHEDRTAR